MLREVGFVVGGALLATCGVGFLTALVMLGAGWLDYGAYLGSLLMMGFGGFLIHVGRREGAERRSELERLEKGVDPPFP